LKALVGFLAFLVNVVVVLFTLVEAVIAIQTAHNPLVWLLLTILFVVTVAMLGQFVARQPEEGAARAHH